MSQTGKDYSYRTVVILIAAALVITAVLSACGSGSSQPPQATPSTGDPTTAIDAAALLQTRCTVCHTLDRVTNSRMTAAQWDQTVTIMISHGAQLTDAEKQALVGYLAKTYGP